MSRAPLRFKESDVCRAIRAARKAGITVSRFEITPDGRIVVFAAETGNGNGHDNQTDDRNEWED
jgi:hypothetical protein